MTNLFKSTYRNFVRKPVTNMINLLGLAVSLALVIILSVYSYSELTTDNYHKNGDRVYLFANFKGRTYMPAILKDQVDLNIPEIESTVRLAGSWEAPVFQVGDHEPITSDIVTADPDFFKLFTYQAIEGNLETALKEPMTIVLTQPLAQKLFGNASALGKSVKMNNDKELTVTAVIREPQANSALSFSSITSIATRKIVMPNGEELTSWGWGNFQLFVLLKNGAKPDEVAKKIQVLFPKNNNESYADLKLNLFHEVYFSGITISDNYLHSGDKRKVMILVLVAALVLIIALVNFIHISSSQWLEKIRQTGVLKVIGAGKSSILLNILSEAFILFLMALFLAILLVQLLFPFISDFTGIHFNTSLLYKPSFLLVSIAGTFLVSLIFSIIPALSISSSKAVDNLKKTVEPGTSNPIFRGVLVTTQFVIAIVLIAFTVLVQKQVNFGSNNLGFGQDIGFSEIIGVVKDFHYKSFNQSIGSLLIQNQPQSSYCLVSLNTKDFLALHNTIDEIRASTSNLSPAFPVEISFFDQAIENLYQSELQFRRTFSLFAGCAVVICGMGILAMSLFACQRRIKEIGIRKVNGARIGEVITMLNRDFVKWVAIAFVIATPIAWYVMNKWLQGFAYKTELSWWIFALAGLVALGIALLTVSWQSWKVATRNPVEALRCE
jgi:ABC-type antimicrobial peptide transport system permease subunit